MYNVYYCINLRVCRETKSVGLLKYPDACVQLTDLTLILTWSPAVASTVRMTLHYGQGTHMNIQSTETTKNKGMNSQKYLHFSPLSMISMRTLLSLTMSCQLIQGA